MPRLRTSALFLACLSFGQSAPAEPFVSSPTPTISFEGSEIVLRMELDGYPNFGVLDTAADVAFTGDSIAWTFALPDWLAPGVIQAASFRASLVLDDHYDVATDLYSFSIETNGSLAFSGAAGLPHGGPVNGQPFSNWTARDYQVVGPWVWPATFEIINTSSAGAGDWIAVDWVELRVSVPEPSSFALAGAAAAALAGLGLGRMRKRPAPAG